MIRKLYTTITTLILCLSILCGQSINSILGSEVELESSDFEVLNSAISNYKLFEINIRKKDIDPSQNSGLINMNLGDDLYKMRLYPNNVKVSADIENLPHLLGGIHSGNGSVSLTINDDFIYGFIREEKTEIYIEPLWYFEPDAATNVYVVYDSKDVTRNGEHTCGVEETEARTPDIIEKTNTTCREVDLAIANDFFMFTSYSTTTGVTNHNLGVLNNVQTNYNCVFNDDLFYNVVTIFIPTSSPDPFTSSTNASALLDNFRAWAGGNSAGGGGAAGASGGFGTMFDMATLWTDRDLDGSTVGIAYVSNWFHVNQDFTNSAVFLNVVWTHEMGHNWSSLHDATGSPHIMAPAVQNTNTWSANSINVINNRINSQSASLPPCGDIYEDNDGDGFGSSTLSSGSGVTNSDDCDDTNALIFPGAPELCDGIINDCNNTTGLPADEMDGDMDGYVICDIDAGGWSTASPPTGGGDCNDTDPSINPEATETCDHVDNDCDGMVDEGLVVSTYFIDSDGDGFGDPNNSIESCDTGNGIVLNNQDCDDTDPNINPNVTEVCDGIDNNCDGQIDEGVTPVSYYNDNDGDGFGAGAPIMTCTPTSSQVLQNGDCDDTDPTINPNAPEVCDGIDNNCNGQIDEGIRTFTFYADTDGDRFGDPNNIIISCDTGMGLSKNGDDCDDTDPDVNPDATEICDGIDNNCDGQIDEGFSPMTYYEDGDADGFGAGGPIVSCNPTASQVLVNGDCDDTEPDVNPNATEVCDGVDNNCDGQIDEGFSPMTYYQDGDSDGFGAGPASVTCNPTASQVLNNGDCDDTDPIINPNANEICDGIDNNCDGQIDEGLVMNYYNDNDGDGFGAGAVIMTCNPTAFQVLTNGDCDDTNPNVNPNATEICDGIDNNCDGQIDENAAALAYYNDNDSDGFGAGAAVMTCSPTATQVLQNGDCDDTNPNVNPNATEICDGIDNNCDGQIDENGTAMTYYNDNDGDGFGAGPPIMTCTPTMSQVLINGDCNDNIAAINPNATGMCDGVDNNCDGIIDFGCQDCDDINLSIDMNYNVLAVNRAEQTIDSDVLLNLNSVLYTAGNNIELLPNFEVAAGKIFEARIEPCIDPNLTENGESENARVTGSDNDALWSQLPLSFEETDDLEITVTSANNNSTVIKLNGENQKIFPQLIENIKSLQSGKYILEVKNQEKIVTKNLNITRK